MLIKEAEYVEEQVTRKKCIKAAVYGCDCCENEIEESNNEDTRLNLTVFHYEQEEPEQLYFCSWDCVLEYLKTVKTDFLVSLPHACFGKEHAGKRSGEYLQELLRNRN